MVAPTQIVDAISTGEDRYVPRYQVLFAKEPISELEPNPPAVKGPVDLATAIEQEFSRLEAKVYRASGDPNNPAPKLGDLLPLAGPWGEKQGQYTNDVVSVEFTESIDKKQPLSKVKVELHNVFDFEARQFRYTDVLKESPDGRPGVFPLIEYGDTLALRFGYGSDILWVFEGIITTLEADFPADGQPKLTITAVDKRERLRNRKKVKRSQFSGMSEEEVAAAVASEVGLTVATVDGQKTMPTKSKGNKPSDQDALQYLTDRANKAALELLCFGNVLFVLKPNDAADKATHYDYRRGLMSFAPTLNNAGKPTAVRVVSRNPTTGEKFDVTVKPEDLQQLGLAPSSKEGETEIAQVKKKGQGGEKVEVVTNYLARSADEAKQIAIGIMKRNMDQSITVSGEVVGDPRVRVRETLQIGGVGRFGGFYYVTETTHRFGANGYQTSFKARRNTALGKTAPEEEPS